MPPEAPPRRKRPDIIAETIRDRIMQEGLAPGDRLHPDWLDPATLGVSRGTLREALKVLEVQGLIRTRTGPGGGVFAAAVSHDHAIRTLDNLFVFDPPSIADIYAIRKLVEPEIAAALATTPPPEDVFEALQATIRLYEAPPETAEEEYRQRLAELAFHEELARHSPNRLMGFTSRVMLSLLRDSTVCRDIYRVPNPELRETGLFYQIRLLRAVQGGDADRARSIMLEHMTEAERYMTETASFVHTP